MPVDAITALLARQTNGALIATSMDGGFLAMSQSTIHLFRFTPQDGFRYAAVKAEQVVSSASVADDNVVLQMSCPSECLFKGCRVLLNDKLVQSAQGPWFHLWRDACAKALNRSSKSSDVCIADVAIFAPEKNGFGKRVILHHGACLIAADEMGLTTVPALSLADPEIITWRADNMAVEMSYVVDKIPHVMCIAVVKGSSSMAPLTHLVEALPRNLRTESQPQDMLFNMGLFSIVIAPQQDVQQVVLERDKRSLLLHTEPPLRCRRGAVLDAQTVLLAENGDTVIVRVNESDGDALVSTVDSANVITADNQGVRSTICLQDTPDRCPIQVSITPDNFRLHKAECISFSRAGNASVTRQPNAALCTFASSWTDANGTHERHLFAPEALAYALWEEWDVHRTEAALSGAGLPELYRQFNEAKKYNLLFILYADIILLNRELNADIGMEALYERINAIDPNEFGKDTRLLDQTVKKVLLWSMMLPRIKQKFELLAAMYPYYCARREIEWIQVAFGQAIAGRVAPAVRQSLVPAVRREVRTAQANIQRSLSEIEAAIRPLEGILAKSELQNTVIAKTSRYLPIVGQGMTTLALLLMGAPMAPILLSSFLLSGVGGKFATSIQNDSEMAAQIRRTALGMFPWWSTFMSTLTVAVFESSQFIDDFNTTAMKRDRSLLDQLKGPGQTESVQRLAENLRRRIIEERRNRFLEVLKGSGIRLAMVVNDIEKVIDQDMRRDVKLFAEGLIFGGGNMTAKEVGT